MQRHAGEPRSWHGDEDLLYWGPRAGNWAHRVLISEDAPHADPDAAFTAVAALPSLTATLVHNLALAATRAREGYVGVPVPIVDVVRRMMSQVAAITSRKNRRAAKTRMRLLRFDDIFLRKQNSEKIWRNLPWQA
jgi:hypothetical protein